jgi:hypothetical protein
MDQWFRECWAEFDPEATSTIPIYHLRKLLFNLSSPLGFDDSFRTSRFLQDKFIASLELPIHDDFSTYHYLDVLDALSFRLMIIEHITKLRNDQLKQLEKQKEETDVAVETT